MVQVASDLPNPWRRCATLRLAGGPMTPQGAVLAGKMQQVEISRVVGRLVAGARVDRWRGRRPPNPACVAASRRLGGCPWPLRRCPRVVGKGPVSGPAPVPAPGAITSNHQAAGRPRPIQAYRIIPPATGHAPPCHSSSLPSRPSLHRPILVSLSPSLPPSRPFAIFLPSIPLSLSPKRRAPRFLSLPLLP